MLVRVHIGRKAGEIRDIEPESARAMLADGRATLVDHDEGARLIDAIEEPFVKGKPSQTGESEGIIATGKTSKRSR